MSDTQPVSEIEEVTDAQIVRSSAVVGVGTALSRITGLLRTVVLAYVLGRFALADAYNLANTTPNIVYDLILGGILSATLVPVFVDRFQHDDEDGVNAVVTVVTSALIGSDRDRGPRGALDLPRVHLGAAGTNAAELERAGVPLLRLFVPQILFYGLMALGTAHPQRAAPLRRARVRTDPQQHRRVRACCCVRADRRTRRNRRRVVEHPSWLWLLGAGTTAGIVAMTVALWPSLRASGWRYRWRFTPRDAAVRKVVALSGWTLGYVIVEPDRAARRPRARGPGGRGRADVLPVRVPVLPAAATDCSRCR